MSEIRRYDDIMQQAIGSMIAQQDEITDFNPGSIIHTFLDTVARLCERNYVAIRQGYNDNLRLVPYSLFRFTRKQGMASTGTVEFQRNNPISIRTVIPKSSRVSGDGKNFITTATGYIESGEIKSNPIPIIAENLGAEYNLPSYTIKNIDSVLPTDVVVVVNNSPTTGGMDLESDNEFDERFKKYLNGLSGTNDYAIMTAALGVPMVRSVSVKNHKPPLNNIYNMSVYVDDGSGSVSEKTIEAVRLAIEGDGTEINQGHLAPGVNIRVMPPLIVPVNFSSIIVSVYRVDLLEAKAEVKKVISEYVNSLTIGKSVIISKVIEHLMKLPYVRDAKIPQENVGLQSDQIARYNEANVEIRESNNE